MELPTWQLDYIIKGVAALLQNPEPEMMPFSEIKEKRGITDDTLTRWIASANIKTYRHGKGKAIRRKDYSKLP